MGSYNSNSMSTQRAKVKSLEENFMDEKNYPVIARQTKCNFSLYDFCERSG